MNTFLLCTLFYISVVKIRIDFFENFLLFVNALLEIRNYFQQIRCICITTVVFSVKIIVN